ncbi:hypothetical protein LCGC14_2541560, partial [marine sediment metagenome]
RLSYRRYPNDECITFGNTPEEAINSAKIAILIDNIGTVYKEDIGGRATEIENNVFFLEDDI